MSSSASQYLLLLLLIAGLVGFIYGAGDYRRDDFPADFVFGSGTSAYQVEGAVLEDGRTPGIWDTYAHLGHVNGNGDIACDAYHKYKEDVQLMVDTNLEAYRFSISWSRLIPNGRGPVNPKGLQYYNNLINELISHGIQPHGILCHMDLPQALEDEYDGWLDKKSIRDFVAYADVCFREFGDRVLHWTTINEANVVAVGGYDNGASPPSRCSPPFGYYKCKEGNSSTEPYIVGHNLLLAHASAVRLYRRKYKAMQHGFVGISIYASWYEPFTAEAENVTATQRAIDFYIGWILNPLVFGDYPYIMKKNVGNRLPTFTNHEADLVKGSLDFIGIIHYTTSHVMDNPSSLETDLRDFYADIGVRLVADQPIILPSQYSVNPSSLLNLLDYLKRAYGNPPIYVYENGQVSTSDGSLNDTPRVEYLQGYIGAVLDALRNGSNTRGYFVWSFLDVYELLGGYDISFGLYYVDREDKELRRYPKLSAHWYSNFLKGGNVGIGEATIKAEDNKWDSPRFHSSH